MKPTLRGVFNKYNRLYFSGKLKISFIRFAKIPRNGYGQTTWFDNCSPIIEISKKLINQGRLVRIALLHEMRHVSLPHDVAHNERFIKSGRRLMRLGAYDDLL